MSDEKAKISIPDRSVIWFGVLFGIGAGVGSTLVVLAKLVLFAAYRAVF